MREDRDPNRRRIARGPFAFELCGLRPLVPTDGHPTRRCLSRARTRRRAGLLPGATFFLIVVFSLVVLERPPTFPEDPQRRAPIASLAHYSFADFAAAANR